MKPQSAQEKTGRVSSSASVASSASTIADTFSEGSGGAREAASAREGTRRPKKGLRRYACANCATNASGAEKAAASCKRKEVKENENRKEEEMRTI